MALMATEDLINDGRFELLQKDTINGLISAEDENFIRYNTGDYLIVVEKLIDKSWVAAEFNIARSNLPLFYPPLITDDFSLGESILRRDLVGIRSATWRIVFS